MFLRLFEPYENKSLDIFCAVYNSTSSCKVRIFKGDGDADRPSKVKKTNICLKNITIVMYHFVRDLENSKFPRINALLDNEFVEQINFLNKNFNIISIDQCIDTLKSKESLPENSCVLTFDDGYIDHFNVVFPVF